MYPYNQHHHHHQHQHQQQPQSPTQHPYPQQVWLSSPSEEYPPHVTDSPQSYLHPQYPPGGYYQPPQSATSPYPQPHPVYIAYNSPPQEHQYSDPAMQPLNPGKHRTDVHRSSSMATHTTFRMNGIQYRPPARRHASEPTIHENPSIVRRPIPKRASPLSSPQHTPTSPIPNLLSPNSPTSSSRSLHSNSSPWGFLFHHPVSTSLPPEGTPKLQRLLRSIGEFLSTLPPEAEAVVTREKLEHYYATFSPHPSLDHRSAYLRAATARGLARLWSWLDCRYYWVPGDTPNKFPDGFYPALTVHGFIRWSTVQLLLCPDLECGVIDCLLRKTPLRDPETPTILWPSGLDREAIGDVDPVAGDRWGSWWSVLLEPDEEENEVEALKRKVKELEGSDVMEIAKRERRRGDEARAQERLEAEMDRLTRELMEHGDNEEEASACETCAKAWCNGCEQEEGTGTK
ncbi:hypothetical protein BDD12DRAFT_887005 [Trichophaea hybrida]|nr:hypothetical protein BDD12DRAFT_887005 [Trichophaea hybrida]